MAHYRVKSPMSGKWFDAPYLGTVERKEEAHHYWEGDPHLRFMVSESLRSWGHPKLILRQVEEEANTFTLDNLTAKFEKDMESDPPVPVLETCECCDGSGTIDERLGGESTSNPEAPCPDCDGEGVVTVGYA